jgi:formate dehydrogenase accessory protein FdhD
MAVPTPPVPGRGARVRTVPVRRIGADATATWTTSWRSRNRWPSASLPGHDSQRLAVTMRTPGDDHDLAVGWLLAEGVIRHRRDILDVSWCVRDEAAPVQAGNVVTVTLTAPALPDLSSLDRHGLVSSACGVCGRASLEALAADGLAPVAAPHTVPWALLTGLPALLREHQPTFQRTGGLHAAARVDAHGRVRAVREDVGRHNAVDKLLGAALLDDDLPWDDQVLVLSGRASYELLQKAVVARRADRRGDRCTVHPGRGRGRQLRDHAGRVRAPRSRQRLHAPPPDHRRPRRRTGGRGEGRMSGDARPQQHDPARPDGPASPVALGPTTRSATCT